MAAQQSSYTQTQAIDRVKGDLGLRSQSFLTDTDITDWLHQAQRIVAFDTHWLRKSQPYNVTSGTATYDLPTDIIAIREVWHNGLPLRIAKTKDIARQYAGVDWRAISGTPTNYYLDGMTDIGLWPKPDTSITSGLTIYYSYFPAAPGSGAGFYTVPTALDYALLEYAKMRACEKDKTGEGREGLALYRSNWKEALLSIKELVGDVGIDELTVIGSAQDFDECDDGVMLQLWNSTLTF